jgi:hypothetical protein
MKTTDVTNLDVTVTYNEDNDLITVSFSEGDRLITVGFNLPEAQMFNTTLAEAITTAILGKIGLTAPTRH